MLTALRVVGAFDHQLTDVQQSSFCTQNTLIHKSMLEVQELRQQLARIIANKFKSIVCGCSISISSRLIAHESIKRLPNIYRHIN
jgi:hypothetical protein